MHRSVNTSSRRNRTIGMLATSGLLLAGSSTAFGVADQWFSWTGAVDSNMSNAGNWINVTNLAVIGGVVVDAAPGVDDFIILGDDTTNNVAQVLTVDGLPEYKRIFVRGTGNRSYTLNPLDASSALVTNDHRLNYGKNPADYPVGTDPVAGLVINSDIVTKSGNGFFIQRLDTAAPTPQINGDITGVSGGQHARLLVASNDPGAQAVLLAGTSRHIRMTIGDDVEAIIAHPGALGEDDGDYNLTMQGTTLGAGVGVPKLGMRVNATLPRTLIVSAPSEIRINQSNVADRTLTIPGNMSGTGPMTLGAAVGGGSGHLTVRVGANMLIPVVMSENTTLDLFPDEQRTVNTSISGAGSLKMSGESRLVVTSPLTHSGGTLITDGELRVLDADTTLGTGNVSLTGDALLEMSDPNSVLANVIGDTATVSLVSTAQVDLEAGLVEQIGALVLNGVNMPEGTYGSTSSLALNQDDTFFSGSGMFSVVAVPEPTAGMVLGVGLVTLAARRRRA